MIEPDDKLCMPQSGIGTVVYFRKTNPCNPSPSDEPFLRLGLLRDVEPPNIKVSFDKVTHLDPELGGWKNPYPTHEKEVSGFILTATHVGKDDPAMNLMKTSTGKSNLLDCKIEAPHKYWGFQCYIEEFKFFKLEAGKVDGVTIKFQNYGPLELA